MRLLRLLLLLLLELLVVRLVLLSVLATRVLCLLVLLPGLLALLLVLLLVLFAAFVTAFPRSAYSRVKSRFLLGKSLGGLISAWAATATQELWTGLIGLSGSFHVDLRFRYASSAILCLSGAVIPKRPIKEPFDPALLVSDPEAVREWEQDPLVSRGKLTVAFLQEYVRAIGALPARVANLRLPVLMLWGTGDKVVTEAGHELMYKASMDGRSHFIKYNGGFHSLLKEPSLQDQVIMDIEAWVANLGKPV